MKTANGRQIQGWTKRYRLFLWGLLFALVVLACCLFYGVSRRSEIPREGTLVYSEEIYEGNA